MERRSVWYPDVELEKRPSLDKNIHTNTVIIGGGLTGILTAYFLQENGIPCVVLEADRIGSGQTKGTTAKVTSQHGVIYKRLMSSAGDKKALQYAQANQRAIKKYEEIIRRNQIDCNWERTSSCLYTLRDGRKLRDEYYAAKKLGLPAELDKKTELPFAVEEALYFHDQARFHPLKFLKSISGNIKVYEKTKVLSVKENHVITEQGKAEAKNVVFACHYPFVNVPGYYFVRLSQDRSYVLALKQAKKIQNMYLGIDPDGLSFRPQDDFLLFGGGGRRTGMNKEENPYDYLLQKAEQYWPQVQPVYKWSAQDCMPLDGIPYIGKFSRKTENWYAATGFQKWGMTSAMVAAELIADRICRRRYPYAEVFSPRRFEGISGIKSFAENGAVTTKSLLKANIILPEAVLSELKPGQGKIVEYKKKKMGIYRSESGELFPVTVRCPHLGCRLSWNAAEKTWDCPCHGSRFDCYGKLIDGPAQTDIRLKHENKE